MGARVRTDDVGTLRSGAETVGDSAKDNEPELGVLHASVLVNTLSGNIRTVFPHYFSEGTEENRVNGMSNTVTERLGDPEASLEVLK